MHVTQHQYLAKCAPVINENAISLFLRCFYFRWYIDVQRYHSWFYLTIVDARVHVQLDLDISIFSQKKGRSDRKNELLWYWSLSINSLLLSQFHWGDNLIEQNLRVNKVGDMVTINTAIPFDQCCLGEIKSKDI